MIADHVDDDIAAYALGALTDEERRRVAEHLAGCPACAGRIEEAEALAGLLPYSVAPHVAPGALKQALFRRLAAEVPVVPAMRPGSSNGADLGVGLEERALQPPPWAVADRRSQWTGVIMHTVPWTVAVIGWLMAAALFVYSHGQSDRLATSRQDFQARLDSMKGDLAKTQQQLADALNLQGYLSTPQLQAVPLTYMAGVARHTTVTLLMAPRYAHAMIVARGLATLPTGKSYVVWAKGRTGSYARLGTLTTGGPRAEGTALVVGPAPMRAYQLVGLSVEQAPAARRPSNPLIFAATLNGRPGA